MICDICGKELETEVRSVSTDSIITCDRCTRWAKKISDDYVMGFGNSRGQG
ncbi:MAG: hypothetical protein SVM80_00325 [Halobacteriota archaeon]|nr:hypothetical protein [Halobacteriota archaeon]